MSKLILGMMVGLIFTACSPYNQESEISSASDIQSMELNEDGTYTVKCRNGNSELTTMDYVLADKVCITAGGSNRFLRDCIEAIGKPQGTRFDIFGVLATLGWKSFGGDSGQTNLPCASASMKLFHVETFKVGGNFNWEWLNDSLKIKEMYVGIENIERLAQFPRVETVVVDSYQFVKSYAALSKIDSLKKLSITTSCFVYKDRIYKPKACLPDLGTVLQISDLEVHFEELLEEWQEIDIDLSEIGKLTQLERLKLVGKHDDHSYLRGVRLDRRSRSISNISFVAKMDRLHTLDLSYSGLKDLEPTVNLTALSSLSITYDHELDNLSPLSKLEKLGTIDLTNSAKVYDLTPIAYLSSLKIGKFIGIDSHKGDERLCPSNDSVNEAVRKFCKI